MCYELPKIINIPWNRVQTTVCNSHEGKDAKAMNQKFLDGHRIRTDNIYHIKSNSIHQPIELVLEKR